MIKLGNSTRTYLLTGPSEDMEAESDLSVTELKRRRLEEIKRREEEEREVELKEQMQRQAAEKKLEERGVDWGIGKGARKQNK